ncbi:DUF1868 domain-containing protein [Fluviispira multicolorata]|uniref:DUF1868 domain-containing protein n=1 Tax=Fluviispira multicolorata TaxID=2654512 RepID=A0A833N5H0_9BACT|nr:DUF1868 domain-containing protein [Fluviispira multicolorata]KAB8033802.1 DUF1868 domain-containing protein [Fluviispira multicolorata]
MSLSLLIKSVFYSYLNVIFIVLIGIIFFFQLSAHAVLTKIDSSGNYCSFPGVTVISNIKDENREMWQKVYKKLSDIPLITEYFALLPVESYHMTTINLYTKKYEGGKKGRKWKTFVTSRFSFFKNLKATLESNAFEPRVNSATLLTPKVSSIISLLVPLDDSQKEKIYDVATQYGIVKKIPNPFHVTLAYSYKKVPDEIRIEINKKVNDILKSILASYEKQPIVFKQPKLSYFLNMTAYLEWNENIKDIDI